MKKKRMKIIKLLVLPIVLILFGCEKEHLENQNHDSQKFRVKEVKLKNLMNESKFRNLLQSITGNSELQRSSFENQNGFTISNENVKIIETDSLISYTMLILPDQSLDTGSFENLVIQEDIFNNLKVAIYKYTPSSITSSIHNSFHFEGTIDKFSVINLSGLNKTSQPITQAGGCYDYILMCNNNSTGGIGAEHPAGANCRRTYMKLVTVLCSSPPFDVGFSSGSGGSGDGGIASPTYDYKEVTTSPIFNTAYLDAPIAPEKTPCQKVKETTDNISGLKPIINNFKTPQVLNLDHEKSFNFVDNAQNQTQLVQNDGNANSTSITVEVTEDGAMTGLVHSHFDRPDMLPTFTFEDLMTFNAIYQRRKYNNKSLDNLTIMVVTRAGVFAMQIEDEAMFATNGYNLWTDQNQQLMDKFNKAIVEKENLTDEDVIVEVTKGLASYGIGMYQANADLSDWSKLTVDENNNKISTPCN